MRAPHTPYAPQDYHRLDDWVHPTDDVFVTTGAGKQCAHVFDDASRCTFAVTHLDDGAFCPTCARRKVARVFQPKKGAA